MAKKPRKFESLSDIIARSGTLIEDEELFLHPLMERRELEARAMATATTRKTSVPPKPRGVEAFTKPFTKRTPAEAAIDEEIISAVEDNVTPCNVEVVRYSATEGKRNRVITILYTKDNLVTLASGYDTKPDDVKVHPDPKEVDKARSAAYFRFSKTGFHKSSISKKESTYRLADLLWFEVFQGTFENNIAAKAQFLALIGAREPGNAFKRTAKKAQEIEEVHQTETQIAINLHRYGDDPGFGVF